MASSSPHESILDAVQAKLATLDLDGLETRIQRRLAFDADWLANLSLPVVVLSGAGTESALASDTGTDNYQYPVTLRIIYRLPLQQQHEAQLFKIRRLIRNAFQSLPLTVEPVPGLLEVYGLTMTGSPTVEVDAQAYQLLSSRLDFQAQTWEER